MDSLVAPALNVAQFATVCAPASSLTAVGLVAVKLGLSLTELTVMVKVWGVEVSTPPLAVPPLSWTATSKVDVPFASAAGA